MKKASPFRRALTQTFSQLQLIISRRIWKSAHNTFAIPLFVGFGQWLLFGIALLGLLCLSLGWEYHDFLAFKNSGYRAHISRVYATVLNQYEKTSDNGTYHVLKLRMNNGKIFYTTTRDKIKNLMHKDLRLNLVNSKVGFWDYMRGFYAFSTQIELLPTKHGIKERLRAYIAKQHESPILSGLYQTLFLADTLPFAWRNNINALAIAHLLAISGFHYGVLSLLVLLLVYFPYSALHRRFFPYRNAFFDIGLITLACGGFYLLLLEHSPSFLRAFAMALCASFLAFCGIRVLSLLSLALTALFLFALFPSLLFSVGFLFSIAGVFYIVLFGQYYGFAGLKNLLFLQCGIFVFMQPLTHFVFVPFSPYSVLAIPLTLAFVVFYPLSIMLHLVGIGGLFDSLFLAFLDVSLPALNLPTPPALFGAWALLSLLAIAHKRLFVLLNLFCTLAFLWNLTLFWLK
ncbi:MAG: ComEC/Rec2 family competence protein [Helicobacter sp.]|nr:ComEC/Rec2 family competence protein [Helicobacter sp.]